MAVSCMRNASGHCRNNSFIVDVTVGQIPRSTERISSCEVIRKFSFIDMFQSSHV